jgi:CRISPR-associated protein Cmr3
MYFAENIMDLEKALTPGDPTMNLEIRHYFLGVSNNSADSPLTTDAITPVVAVPNDLVIRKDSSRPDDISLLELHQKDQLVAASNYTLPYLLRSPVSVKLENLSEKAFLDIDNFGNYLQGKSIAEVVFKDDYLSFETKTGIERNDVTRTAKTGMLYSLKMIRTEGPYVPGTRKKTHFLIGYDGVDLEMPQTLRFGGQGKQVSCFEWLMNINIPAPQVEDDLIFKMLLVTPGIFEEGWLPAALLAYYSVEVVAAAIGKIMLIGGWDMKQVGPKPMLKAVPAGSVYFLRGKKNGSQKFIDDFHGTTLVYSLSASKDNADKGYNKVYFGLPYQQQLK